jgi:hypothetical protein
MKTIGIFVLLIISASFIWASDWESHELLDRLLAIREPGTPVIHDGWVIFTADSSLRRVGVSFAHENFANIYWFRMLLVSQDRMDPIIPTDPRIPSTHRDSGVMFYVYQIPEHLMELEYRLIVNGLWTTDPLNPQIRRDPVTGLSMSFLRLPHRQLRPNPLRGLPEGLRFSFAGPPGETIT